MGQVSDRHLCTDVATIDPAPTADATRFITPAHTFPAAKMPGTLVSSGSGSRRSFHTRGKSVELVKSRPMSTHPFSSRSTRSGSHSLRGRVPMKTNAASASSTDTVPAPIGFKPTRSTWPSRSTNSTSISGRSWTIGVFPI